MIGAIFNSNYGPVPVIITGHKSRHLVEVLAVKCNPFTKYSAGGQPGTHAVKSGYVRKADLTSLRSTRIISDPCELCGREMTDGWCQHCWDDEETGLSTSKFYKLAMRELELRNFGGIG
jgi:hypothetical protein